MKAKSMDELANFSIWKNQLHPAVFENGERKSEKIIIDVSDGDSLHSRYIMSHMMISVRNEQDLTVRTVRSVVSSSRKEKVI